MKKSRNARKWVLEVWDIFHMIQLDRDVLIRRLKQNVNLSLPLVRLLLQIDEMKDASQTAIAESLGLDVGNLSRMCRQLEDRNLIVRERSPRDRRAMMVRLSEEGQQMADQIIHGAQDILSPHLDGLSDEEIAKMCFGMRKFIDISEKVKERVQLES